MVKIEVRALRPEELESWFEFNARSSDQPRSHVVNRWEGDPHRMLEGILIAQDGGQILSGLRIFAREIYLGGLPVAVGGVGDLCTEESDRGHALEAMLVDEAIRFMGQRAMALSLLFRNESGRFAEYGWKPVPMQMGISHLTVDTGVEGFEVALANLRDPAEARQMQVIYEESARHLQGAMVRSDLAYWTGWLSGQWKRAFVGRKAGRPVGYLAAEWAAPDEIHVADFAAVSGEVVPLFRALVRAMARERSLESVRVRYPLALQLDMAVTERQLNSAPMYRVLQPPLLPLQSAQALEGMLRGDLSGHMIWPADWF